MNDITTRARALHSVAEARERLMERELLAIWATVRSGNPAPLTEFEVLHAVEDVRRERDALRDEVERLRAELASVMGECARLRSDVDVEREQSAEFMKEIERLKAGIADAERWAAHSAAGEAAAIGVIKRAVSDMLRIPVSIEALAVSAIRQSLSDFRPSVAGSRMLDRIERAEAERDALRARKAEVCDCVHATGRIGESFVDVDDDCPKCGGSGGVVVEGEK